MVVTYYIKLFGTGADKHNGILMSLLFLVAEKIKFLMNSNNKKEKSTVKGTPINDKMGHNVYKDRSLVYLQIDWKKPYDKTYLQ